MTRTITENVLYAILSIAGAGLGGIVVNTLRKNGS